jgi:uncharacterized damage-inducible protein DinB
MDSHLGEQLLDTWGIHARTTLYVLDNIDPVALMAKTEIKGRSVGEQFAHLHNVRLMWLQAAAPDLLEGLAKIGKGASLDMAQLRGALDASGRAIGDLLRSGLMTGRIKQFKPHPTAFLGYLVAHESFHQGDIGVRLTQSGHPLDQKAAYGMWEWGTR